MTRNYRYILLFALFLLAPGAIYAQCSGISLGSYLGSAYQFNSYSQLLSGGSVTDYITLQYQLPYQTNCPGWSLKVRATNFTNGTNTISPAYVSLRFNRVTAGGPSGAAIGVSGSAVALNTTDVTLINQSNAPLQAPPDYYIEQKYDLAIQGGAHLLAGSGTFSSTLTFSLYSNTNQLMASYNVSVSFQVNYSNSCSGATVGGYFNNASNMSTYAQLQAGATATDAVTVQYSPNAATCIGWSLKVRANGNFTNGTNSVAPQYVSLRFNRVNSGSPSASAIGVSATSVPLSNSDVSLIANSNAPFVAYGATEHKFDMIVQGGNHLLLPTGGTYSATLTFSLYNSSNQLVSSVNVTCSFQVSFNSNSNYTVTLASPNVDMLFASQADFASGISVTKVKGLKIVGYSAHQVLVKTSAANLVSGASSSTIPVSVVNLLLTKATGSIPNVTTFQRSLSASDQVVATNPMTDFNYQTTEYDLKYFTNPMSASSFPASGTFTTSVIYVVIPL